jgi:5-(carboxyamino)imidazole ribonucleotide synthase
MITPPSTIGIIGGGQLGMMLAREAKRMGYKVLTLDPTGDCPCAQICDGQIIADFDDKKKVYALAKKSDVLTYEFENVPSAIISLLEESGFDVFPSSSVLHITQDRIKEKQFLRSIGVPTADFAFIENHDDFKKAASAIGLPSIIKTTTGGYDGKGQYVLKNKKDLLKIDGSFFHRNWIWERFVPFLKEISVICSRSIDGSTAAFPVPENIHRNNILYMSIIPARIPEKIEKKAIEIAKKVACNLGYVGVIGVEMFYTKEGEVLVNEVAPRVHNSGHYTIEACSTSQFEEHIRMICGLPHGSTRLLSPAVMVNIIGDDASNKKSVLRGIDRALRIPGVSIHMYGKKDVKPGRKMGHMTILDDSTEACIRKAKEAILSLQWR